MLLQSNIPFSGCTPLHGALNSGLVCLSMYLLQAGADPEIPSNSGHTAMYTIIYQLVKVRISEVFRVMLSLIM